MGAQFLDHFNIDTTVSGSRGLLDKLAGNRVNAEYCESTPNEGMQSGQTKRNTLLLAATVGR